jgi:hypothetical protein
MIGAILAGGSILGSLLGGSSQKKAARRAEAAALQTAAMNNALARDIYNQNRTIVQPYVDSGQNANAAINSMLGIGGDRAAQDAAFERFRGASGYNFRMGEGLRGIDATAQARGTLRSGDRDRRIVQFGQDIGSQEIGNYMGMLGNQQSIGMSGANALMGVGNNMVGQVTQNNNDAGSARANAALMRGNISGQTIGSIANSFGQMFGSSFGR